MKLSCAKWATLSSIAPSWMRRGAKHTAEVASALAGAATQPALEEDLESMANRVLERLIAMRGYEEQVRGCFHNHSSLDV